MPMPSMQQLLLTVALCLAASLSPAWTLAGASDGKGGKPLATPVTKDVATSLYASPLRGGRPLVLDLSGPLIWTTCGGSHPTVECHHPECAHAHSHHPPGCPHNGYGVADEEDRFRCKCTAHPHNPFTGESATADLTHVTLSANATDGSNPLYTVSFSAVASCAPGTHLAGLPAGAVGVAGLANTRLALPAQVARTQKVPGKFLLCLPRRGDGVAIFGGGPLFIPPSAGLGDLTARLTYTPLLSRKGDPAYYLPVNGIAVDKAQLPLPGDALAGGGGVVLDTKAPYTALRADVYRQVVDAFNRTLGRDDARRPAVAPFELCYDGNRLGPTRIGYLVPDVDLMLEGGKNWTLTGRSSMVDLPNGPACFAFVKMDNKRRGGYGKGPAPAVVIGGFQMEDNVLQFDLEKRQLGFGLTPWFEPCNNFNFTRVQ